MPASTTLWKSVNISPFDACQPIMVVCIFLRLLVCRVSTGCTTLQLVFDCSVVTAVVPPSTKKK